MQAKKTRAGPSSRKPMLDTPRTSAEDGSVPLAKLLSAAALKSARDH
jgi:hypothetical protein